jgi:hypothetical protein
MPGMETLQIDGDALFRAVIAYDYKLIAYYLDLRSGEIVSRTLTPEEVQEPPPGPRVKPLPLLGGDLHERKSEALFADVPGHVQKKPDLFKDDGSKKKAFEGDFWKRGKSERKNPFGEEFRRESSTKKLAEMFGEAPPEQKKPDPLAPPPAANRAAPTASPSAPTGPAPQAPPAEGSYVPVLDLSQPLQRIPPASVEQNVEWMRAFAKDCGDPKIKDQLLHALAGGKPIAAFERTLRQYQRTNQQWDRYYRRQAYHYAGEWLKALPIQWEIVQST